ncbi:MAG: tRNA (N6-threonylcarbamoyladenosine(37)-N6)-methyltransferase TrmO [Bdellovibrionales bacterium]
MHCQTAPVGILHSDFGQRFGTPRQGIMAPSSRATLQLLPKYRGQDMLSGLEEFSHIWLISHLSKAQSKKTRGKVRPPRLAGKKIGLFATRSPHHPGGLGLTLARILKVEADTLYLAEVDLLDQTEILDIKPYVAPADRPEQFRCGWLEGVKVEPIPVSFSKVSLEQLKNLAQIKSGEDLDRLRRLIEEVLAQDPRPLPYRKLAEGQFDTILSDANVRFRFSAGAFVVDEITPI